MSEPTQQEVLPTGLNGKCSYSLCDVDPSNKTEEGQYITIKDTEYNFHVNCFVNWKTENRAEGRFEYITRQGPR